MPEKKSKPFPKTGLPVKARPAPIPATKPETITPETPTTETAAAETDTRSSEPDWDNIFVADEPQSAHASENAETISKPADDKPVLMSEETFYGYFELGFAAPNELLKNRPPFPLESLPISPGEEARARGASRSIYKIILETEGLHWLLTKDSPWMQKALPIFLFFSMKTMAVSREIRAKREQKVRPADGPEAPSGPAANQQAQTPQHADLASGAAGVI